MADQSGRSHSGAASTAEPPSALALQEAMDAIAAPSAPPGLRRRGLPSTVYGRLRDLQNRDLTVLTAPHDGTEEGVRRATESLQHRADREAWPWSAVLSAWIATDASGVAAWAISPNLRFVSPVGSEEAAHTLGGGAADDAPRGSGTVSVREARAARAKAIAAFRAVADVAAAWVERDLVGLAVLVDVRAEPPPGARIPTSIDGVRVRFRVVGPVRGRGTHPGAER